MSNSIIANVHVFLSFMAGLFVFAVGLGILAVFVLYVIDRTQKKQAVRRNFPVIGRFRYLFEQLGEFFRQYFFAADREEMPFNRAERSWVYRAAKGLDSTVAFGSSRDLRPTGITTHDSKLQRGLDPVDKAERVSRYAEQMRYELRVIAHSCGVAEPRLLKRHHCRLVQNDGRSKPLDEIYPPIALATGVTIAEARS